jgi:hypothetical protein
VNPANITDTLAALHRKRPDLDFELLAPHTFFVLFKRFQEQHQSPSRP